MNSGPSSLLTSTEFTEGEDEEGKGDGCVCLSDFFFSSKPGRYFSHNQALLSTAYLFFFSHSYLISSPILSYFETKFAGSLEKDLSL